MNKDEFPVVIWKDKRLLVVPELVSEGSTSETYNVCSMCFACDKNKNLCSHDNGLNGLVSKPCGDTNTIFLPEEEFETYLVERWKVRLE